MECDFDNTIAEIESLEDILSLIIKNRIGAKSRLVSEIKNRITDNKAWLYDMIKSNEE